MESAATSDVYQNKDGTYTRRTYAGAVNYRAADGSWRPIDTALARGAEGRWREKANAAAVDFAASAADPVLASVPTPGGGLISYRLAGAGPVAASVDGATATYTGVLPDTDLVLSATPGGMKETLVLRSARAATSWLFPLTLRGLTASVTADGSVELRDGAGAVAATIPHGYMSDSKYDPHSGLPAESDGVTYRVVTVDGGPALQVSVDAGWLADRARVFPVRVDPTVNEYPSATTFADTKNPGNNAGKVELRVGTPNGGGEKAYSFLEFANFGARYAGNRIGSATLHAFAFWAYNCDANRFDVSPITQPWTAPGVTSYPGPGIANYNVGWSSQRAPHACANGSGGGCHNPAFVEINYTPDTPPQVDGQYPPDNYNTTTLTPELLATGHDPDNWPGPLQYQFTVVDSNNQQVASSGLVGAGDWVVPPGRLVWGKSYYWTVQTFDGYTYSDPNAAVWRYLGTPVPQPVVTSGLSQNAGHGFEPSIGNYTTSVTDAQVATVGPALSVLRDYNSADPRITGAFGAGGRACSTRGRPSSATCPARSRR